MQFERWTQTAAHQLPGRSLFGYTCFLSEKARFFLGFIQCIHHGSKRRMKTGPVGKAHLNTIHWGDRNKVARKTPPQLHLEVAMPLKNWGLSEF